MTSYDKPVRVRMAPSPTGYFHLGSARTALYNWLYARHTGGTFILRIEDTDQARFVPDSVQDIMDGLRWLGLQWDEGLEVGGPHAPYYQSQRLPLYQAWAAWLVKAGHAYRCYCSEERLDALRREQQASGAQVTPQVVDPREGAGKGEEWHNETTRSRSAADPGTSWGQHSRPGEHIARFPGRD